jgi:hypothetical protein
MPDPGEASPKNLVAFLKLSQIEYSGRTGCTRKATISAVDAKRMFSRVANERVAPIAADVKRRLGQVVARASRNNGPR